MLERFPDKPVQVSADMLERIFHDSEYIGTFKRDGFRAVLCHTSDGEYSVFSSSNSRIDRFSDFDPQILEALKQLDLPRGTYLDGEWERRRAGNKEGLNRCAVWGVLRWEGQWLHKIPEEQRWAKTLSLKLDGKYIYVPAFADTNFRELFNRSKLDCGNEGIVLKHKKSQLVLDTRGTAQNKGWYKVKWRDGPDGQTIIA